MGRMIVTVQTIVNNLIGQTFCQSTEIPAEQLQQINFRKLPFLIWLTSSIAGIGKENPAAG
jgi:hypothetical protein